MNQKKRMDVKYAWAEMDKLARVFIYEIGEKEGIRRRISRGII